MFSKLFDSMYDGTLRTRSPWQALVTFQQLLILADPTGVCDITLEALEFRTGIPIEILRTGIAALEAPDPDSRLPNDEGRRITRLDDHRNWGWRVTNFLHYRDLQSNEARREYQREWQRSQRAAKKGANGANLSTGDDSGRQATTDDDDVETRRRKLKRNTLPQNFAEFWKAYPRRKDKQDALKAWTALNPDDDLLKTILDAIAAHSRSTDWSKDGGQFIPYPATWLRRRRWEDELEGAGDDRSKRTLKLAL